MGKAIKRLAATENVLSLLASIRRKPQEYLVCITLDSAERIIRRRIITIGLLDLCIAHPREVFTGAVRDRAASIIVSHNHTSGLATPSDKDIETTQQLVAAGQILGIPLRDHIIVTRDEEFSFMKHLML